MALLHRKPGPLQLQIVKAATPQLRGAGLELGRAAKKSGIMTAAIKTFAIALLGVAFVPLCANATSVVTFETAHLNLVDAPVTEAGMIYSVKSGALYVNTFGNPGQDLEGDVLQNGGVVQFVSATPGRFTFEGLDFDAYSDSGLGSQTISIMGYLGGSLVGTDSYTRANSNGSSWATFAANNLKAMNIDLLTIGLGATRIDPSSSTIDNVRFGPAVVSPAQPGVPEPATWAMMLLGFGGIGLALRHQAKNGRFQAACR